MKIFCITVLLLFYALNFNGQNDYLKLTNGKSMRVEITYLSDSVLSYKEGDRNLEYSLKTNEIAFMETYDNGVTYYS